MNAETKSINQNYEGTFNLYKSCRWLRWTRIEFHLLSICLMCACTRVFTINWKLKCFAKNQFNLKRSCSKRKNILRFSPYLSLLCLPMLAGASETEADSNFFFCTAVSSLAGSSRIHSIARPRSLKSLQHSHFMIKILIELLFFCPAVATSFDTCDEAREGLYWLKKREPEQVRVIFCDKMF